MGAVRTTNDLLRALVDDLITDNRLTPREAEILRAVICQRVLREDVAGHLEMKSSTAKVHVGHILAKLGAATLDDIVIRVLRDALARCVPPSSQSREANAAEDRAPRSAARDRPETASPPSGVRGVPRHLASRRTGTQAGAPTTRRRARKGRR